MSIQTKINIPEVGVPRLVIVGGGFAGISLARRAARMNCQVVLIDRNNYHQFQPLFYQVAMSGLEPSSISFPFRKLFQGKKNVYIRVTEVTAIKPEQQRIETPLGYCNYDHLVLCTGTDTNFYGNEQLEKLALPMKSVSEALYLRNTILDDYEKAVVTTDYEDRQGLIDVVIVGGGPTGVELAGSLSEMKHKILPKDYPELAVEQEMDIYLIQSGDSLLKGMSKEASDKSLEYLREMGVNVLLNKRVKNYDGTYAHLDDDSKIRTDKLIWAAGVKGVIIPGLAPEVITRGNRFKVDRFNRVQGLGNVYAIGDIAYMEEDEYTEGHPQVAQVAIQMGDHLAANLRRSFNGENWKEFSYRDKGSMATVGRARAVVDLPNGWSFGGLFAWLTWLLVHLFAILGTRNKLFVFVNWLINYINYNQSLRLIIRPRNPAPDMERYMNSLGRARQEN